MAGMTACIEANSSDHRYPRTWVNGRAVILHRVVYEQARGPIPTGLTVDHLCFNKKCINIDHLELVTRAENTRRQWLYRRGDRAAQRPGSSPCRYGHAPNWYRQPSGWKCRSCMNEQSRRRRAGLPTPFQEWKART